MWEKPWWTRVLVAVMVVGFAAVVVAQSPHYKKGGKPVCTISGDTVTCSTGQVAGLGGFDVLVTMSFTASQGQVCHNKGNPENVVAGQNPAKGTGGDSVPIDADEQKNGSLTIPALTGTANITASSPKDAGCPNNNWTVTLEGPITISGGTYTFESPPGTVIPSLSFKFP